jgi:hypothetical protein
MLLSLTKHIATNLIFIGRACRPHMAFEGHVFCRISNRTGPSPAD